MIHPSYNELFAAINGDDEDNQKIISSRYSVCVATAKRARQLIDGAEPLADKATKSNKPLSIAVEEIYEGKVKVLGEDQQDEYVTLDDAEDSEIIVE